MNIVLALDQSTSATKALLFSATGELLARAARDHRQIYPQPGWVEHDAEEIFQNTLAVLGEIVSQNAARTGSPLCLSLTNQRETIVVFDTATGQPLYHAIVWQCRRGDAICAALEAQGHGPRVQQLTGLKIDTYFPASKLTWLF